MLNRLFFQMKTPKFIHNIIIKCCKIPYPKGKWMNRYTGDVFQ